MDAGGKWLSRERGAFEREPVPETLHKPEATVRATAPFSAFLKTEDERDWIAALFVRLVSGRER